MMFRNTVLRTSQYLLEACACDFVVAQARLNRGSHWLLFTTSYRMGISGGIPTNDLEYHNRLPTTRPHRIEGVLLMLQRKVVWQHDEGTVPVQVYPHCPCGMFRTSEGFVLEACIC